MDDLLVEYNMHVKKVVVEEKNLDKEKEEEMKDDK